MPPVLVRFPAIDEAEDLRAALKARELLTPHLM